MIISNGNRLFRSHTYFVAHMVLAVQVSETSEGCKIIEIRVELTYLNQMISSPHGMLPYNTYQSCDPNVLMGQHSIGGKNVLTDMSGKRVTSSCKFAETAYAKDGP